MVQITELIRTLCFAYVPEMYVAPKTSDVRFPVLSLAQIKAQNLFGDRLQASVEEPDDDIDGTDEDALFRAPVFKGPGILRGIVVSDDPERSVAIIDEDQRQQSYVAGEVINGSRATILRIFPDRVAIKSNNSYFTLRLPE